MAYALRTRADAACPLRARSAGQYGELTVTPGQPNRLTHLRTGRLTRCAHRPSKQPVARQFHGALHAGGPALGAARDENPADTNLRSGRASERATMVKMSRTRSSSSNVTRLVTSSPVLALVLDVLASVEMLPVSSSATFRTLPMVNDMSSFTFAA